MDNNVISILENYKNQWTDPAILTSGISYDTEYNIRKVTRYMNSLFMGSSKFSNGLDKIFYNITIPAVINSAKNTDLDTKDIFYKAENPDYRINAFFLNTKLRRWNDDNNMGVFINNLNIHHTAYGFSIVKDADPCPKIMNLEKFKFDTSIPNLDNTFDLQGDFAIDEMELRLSDIEGKIGKGWDEEAIKKVKTAYNKINKKAILFSTIKTLEAHMYCPREVFDDGDDYGFYKTYIVDDSNFGIKELMYWEREEKLPFKKLDYNKREIAAGKGVVEELFEEQKNINTVVNYYNQSLAVASLNIFQTQDPTLMKNVIRDARSGDIFNTNISPINTADKNVQSFQVFKEMLEDVGRRKTNSFEFLTGENLPANQTLGGQIMQTQQGAKWFDVKRENLGMFLDEVYNDWVLPRFEKSISQKEVLDILDIEELQEIWEVYTNKRINQRIAENLLENDTVPTLEEIASIREQEIGKMEKKNLWEVTKEYLTGYKKKLYIDTSGEKHNLGQKISVMSQVLLNSNMIDVLSNPVTKRAGEQLLELVGFDKNLIKSAQAQGTGEATKSSQDAVKQLAQNFTNQGASNLNIA